MTAPLTRAELLALPPTTNLVTLGRALGLSEPTIRAQARAGTLDDLGIRCLRLGHKYVIPTADLWRFLGIDPGKQAAESAQPDPADLTELAPTKDVHDSRTRVA
jgi:hypothetical protein